MRRTLLSRLILMPLVPTVFAEVITESFRAAFPDISIDLLAPGNRAVAAEMRAFFDQVITMDRVNPEAVRRALMEAELSRYDVALVVTEKSSVDFDDPVVYKVAKVLGRKVLLVDYNMRFYSRFLSRWFWPLRKRARNWIFYKQEPLLSLWDMKKLAERGLRHLVLSKQVETPDMEKAKKMRDRALLAQREAEALAHGVEQFDNARLWHCQGSHRSTSNSQYGDMV
jgi:hypothetical protein